jgi:FkbM family methyltransferase
MPRYTGHGLPPLPQRILDGLALRAHARLERVLTVGDGPPLKFRVRTIPEYNRATHAFAKEPGTLTWLAGIRPGDVVYDVGANVGVYTLLAAHRVGPAGRVYAFEPHAATTATLLENVTLNGLGDRVDVLSCALHGSSGVEPFLYGSLAAGSALSQVGGEGAGARELKAVAAADDLIAGGTLAPADLIKIDVDGNEAGVLAGMRGLLTGADRPRSVQVEVNPDDAAAVLELMTQAGYRETGRHRSGDAERLVRNGADPATLGANVIFEPTP